eukprot:TRINITY_DN53998_c0_g1_i1.p1 TRINITY_DN53998_c0_g1~~TRINITY_DN53998_c0_g1_i1.p1  ORF type:complete len:244 (+),score=24.45 TRINITY_DN53998_c0_g1_i1:59-790(+)
MAPVRSAHSFVVFSVVSAICCGTSAHGIPGSSVVSRIMRGVRSDTSTSLFQYLREDFSKDKDVESYPYVRNGNSSMGDSTSSSSEVSDVNLGGQFGSLYHTNAVTNVTRCALASDDSSCKFGYWDGETKIHDTVIGRPCENDRPSFPSTYEEDVVAAVWQTWAEQIDRTLARRRHHVGMVRSLLASQVPQSRPAASSGRAERTLRPVSFAFPEHHSRMLHVDASGNGVQAPLVTSLRALASIA